MGRLYFSNNEVKRASEVILRGGASVLLPTAPTPVLVHGNFLPSREWKRHIERGRESMIKLGMIKKNCMDRRMPLSHPMRLTVTSNRDQVM